MTVYRYTCDSNRFNALDLTDSDVELLDTFDGRSLARTWDAPQVSWRTGLQSGDFPRWSGHVPVLSDRAWNALESLIAAHVEHLPLRHAVAGEPTIAALNVIPILDAFDEERADIRRSDGIIVGIRHYAFNAHVIGDRPIFRVKGDEVSSVYVTEVFRKRVKQANLQGLLYFPLP